MKIAYLGTGTWAYCLAALIAQNDGKIVMWARNEAFVKSLQETRQHPKLPNYPAHKNISFTSDLQVAIKDCDLIVESVTSSGIRPVFQALKELAHPTCPIILTSKGIEQKTGLLPTQIVIDVLGESVRSQVGCLSGPSLADEVMQGLPASVVCSAYEAEVMDVIQKTFSTPKFRIYPNSDIDGVEFGGAMKNIIAIACGIADGLGYGANTKAALMTRGLHEMRKLAVDNGCQAVTLNGLAGMGDLCTTCLSPLSRNYRFGSLLAEGHAPEDAKQMIGSVIEGAYTCVSALELGEKGQTSLPITEVIYQIIYEGMTPNEAVMSLLNRVIKEEHL